jgi:hypothetical protein
MSTKTTFKRIALVAVAALGLGTLSAFTPATAVVSGEALSIDYAASSIELGQDAVLVMHQDFIATGAAGADTQTVTISVTTNAFTSTTVNSAAPKVFLGSETSTVSTGTAAQVARGYATGADLDGFPAADITAGSVNRNNTQSVTGNESSVITVKNVNSVSGASAITSVRGFQRVQWKPTLVGTYSLTVKTYPADNATVATNSYVWTFTVVAAGTAATAAAKAALALQTPSASFSRSVIGYKSCTLLGATSICDTTGIYANHAYGANGYGSYATTMQTTLPADDSIAYPKNLTPSGQSIQVAGILGNLNSTKSTGNTMDPMPGAYVWAEISGPGWLTLEDPQQSSTNVSTGRSTWIKLSSTTDATYRLYVGTDGTAGKATVTVYAANSPTATKVKVAEKTVNFFDTPAKASLTRIAYSINGDAAAAATTVATLSVKDAGDITIPYAHFTNLGYYATAASSDITVLPAQTALTSKSVTLQPKGAIYGTSDVTVTVQNDAGSSAAKIVAATAVPTGFSDAGKLIPTVKFAAAAQSVIVAKNQIASLTITPTSGGQFNQGAKETLTFVAKDVNGLAVPDALTATVKSLSTVATSVATQNGSTLNDFNSLATLGAWGLSCGGVTVGLGTCPAGTFDLTLYAPIAEGDFTLSMLLGGASSVAGTAGNGFSSTLAGTTATLKLSVNESAATTNAQEAIDAANAATDAANAAAEAADAATAAAQDAADQVAALSTSVSAMITALKKQITALTTLVIKIQKKVKA